MSKVVSEEFEKLKQELIQAYDSKGMRASGEFAESLEVEQTERGAKLYGAGYAVQLEYGRGATTGSGVGGESLRDKIKQWIQDKGIQAKDNISDDSLVFLITRKIHRDGWKREGYGGVGLISSVLTDARFDEIIERAKESINEEFIKIIRYRV